MLHASASGVDLLAHARRFLTSFGVLPAARPLSVINLKLWDFPCHPGGTCSLPGWISERSRKEMKRLDDDGKVFRGERAGGEGGPVFRALEP